MTPDLESQLADAATAQVREGFDDLDTIISNLCDEFTDDANPAATIAPLAERAVRRAHDLHLAEQATWPIPTDNDRLDRAFASLEATGIVARQHFTCCQTCGFNEIADELTPSARGFTFFHMQDTEGAVNGRGLYLAYDSTTNARGDQLKIAQEIVAALEKEGLTPQWDGTTKTRILIPLTWRKRRPRTP